MGLCATNCGIIELIDNPLQCIAQPRLKKPSRLGFYACNTSLPDPLNDAAIEALIASGEIVYSSALGNFVPQAPTTQDIAVDDCTPARRIIASREIQFQDRIGIDISNSSPLVESKYHDYDFWNDKQVKQLQLNYLIEYCDGDNVIPLDQNGNPLSASLFIFLDYERSSTQGGASTEFKSGSIIFNGDPLALYNKPAFNRAADGTITVYTY